MKNLMNLNGVKALDRKAQKSINGGAPGCPSTINCIWRCYKGKCIGPDLS